MRTSSVLFAAHASRLPNRMQKQARRPMNHSHTAANETGID